MQLALLTALAACSLPGPSAVPTVEVGVNGHPLAQEGYRQVPVAAQLDLVARLGAKWYRCDWGDWALAGEGADRAASLFREAARRRVRILPIIFPRVDMARDDEETIRRKARAYAKDLVGRYKRQVRVWELHNELDCWSMIHKGERDMHGALWQWGDPAGDKPEHYEEGRYAKARAVLTGLAEGVRDADRTAQRIVNTGGWLHFGFVERLVADKVPFDILSWHWYSEMGDMTRAGGINVLERIAAFGKPIWITEYNRRGGSLGPNGPEEQAATLGEMTRRFRELAATYPIRAVMAYELLDEPYFGADNPESHYGLVEIRKGSDGRWTVGADKPAFEAVKRAFAAEDRRARDQAARLTFASP